MRNDDRADTRVGPYMALIARMVFAATRHEHS